MCCHWIYAIVAIKHVLSFINIRKVPREVLKTSFQHLPRDLAYVNEWKIMFDPYNITHKKCCIGQIWLSRDFYFHVEQYWNFAITYRNDPKFLDRYAWANSADPDQTAPVCHSVCVVWTHYSMVESHSSNFRVTTTNFLVVRIFRKFTVQQSQLYFSGNTY